MPAEQISGRAGAPPVLSALVEREVIAAATTWDEQERRRERILSRLHGVARRLAKAEDVADGEPGDSLRDLS